MAKNLKLLALVALPAIGLAALFFFVMQGEEPTRAAASPVAAAPGPSARPLEAAPEVPEPLRNPGAPIKSQATAPVEHAERAELAVQAPAPTTPIEDAVAWLARILPAQFANLTPAQALEMETLDLRGAAIADADLKHLTAFPKLAILGLRGTGITDAGLPSLSALQQLKSLDLRATKITGLALGSLPWRLEALHLTETGVKGTDLFVLTSMPNLATLKLNSLATVDDAALDMVAGCTALRHLEIDNTAITDAGLRNLLEKNPNLTRIEMRQTGVSSETLQDLTQRYPRCEFVSQTVGTLGVVVPGG